MTLAPPSPADFSIDVRVYWEDTDAGGVVYYANYLKFFERARTEWLRSHGIDQQAVAREQGLLFVVSRADVRYCSPARLDDALRISASVTQAGGASLEFVQEARRLPEDTLLASATVRVACVGAADFRPARLPAHIGAALAAIRRVAQ